MSERAMRPDPAARAVGLPCWSGKVTPEPLEGGITNVNFVVTDKAARYFVRIGEDIPVHGVMRFNELAVARAAAAAGISPEVLYSEPGVIVTRFIEGRTLEPEDIRKPADLERIVALIKRCHHEIPKHLRGPILIFWVFHVIRDYGATLRDGGSRSRDILPGLMARAARLEAAVGSTALVLGHNDLLAGNFIDDGGRLWLVDWEYAGYNSPLFDLANLASNNEFPPELEAAFIAAYRGAPADAAYLRRYHAMKCASLLREAMWSMVSEIHSALDFDYVAYTGENLARFERAYRRFEKG
ncbi:MAG: phosphotransferase [Kiloniellaceae bacterium]